MIANKAFVYDGRNLMAGEEFDAVSEQDRRVLFLAGLAHESDNPIADMPRRKYRRRDMKAEE